MHYTRHWNLRFCCRMFQQRARYLQHIPSSRLGATSLLHQALCPAGAGREDCCRRQYASPVLSQAMLQDGHQHVAQHHQPIRLPSKRVVLRCILNLLLNVSCTRTLSWVWGCVGYFVQLGEKTLLVGRESPSMSVAAVLQYVCAALVPV